VLRIQAQNGLAVGSTKIKGDFAKTLQEPGAGKDTTPQLTLQAGVSDSRPDPVIALLKMCLTQIVACDTNYYTSKHTNEILFL
jgi:hypothetical protein